MKLLRTLLRQRTATPIELDFSMNRQFLHSDAARPRLRIGILYSNRQIPRYASQIIKDITASNFADIVYLLEYPEVRVEKTKRFRQLLRYIIESSRNRCLLYRSYHAIVGMFRKQAADPLKPIPIDGVLPHEEIAHLLLACGEKAFLPGELNLDVILNLGSLALNDCCPAVSRHGIWFYRLGSGNAQTNDDELVASVLTDPSSTARITLEKASGTAARPLVEAFFSMTPTLSAHENRFPPFWGSTHFVIEMLLELHASGKLDMREQKPLPLATLRGPTTRQIIAHQTGRLRRFAGRLPERLQQGEAYVHWDIALRHSPVPLLEEESNALQAFHWLRSPPGHFWADPFLLEHHGSTWLFFEDYVLSEDKGRIACGRINEDGELSDIQTVLDKPWHLSYPQIFIDDGEIFMVPESANHHSVDLFRATSFPTHWVYERQLLDVCAVDATLAEHDDRWWMFASPMTIPGHAPMTYLWSAEKLTGEWQLTFPHAINSDVSRSRGAGSLYRHNGRDYRVSQDDSTAYGAALWFNEITRWDIHHYQETPVRRLDGHEIPGLTGIHSYNRAGDWEVIDGRFLRSTRPRQNNRAS